MTKSLIINADDFGFDEDATTGILDLLSIGKIPSTTVMANCVNEKDLILLKKIANIGIGLHLNLIEGVPISPLKKIPDLINEKGEFLGAKKFLKNAIFQKIPEEQVFMEVKAQLVFLESRGIKITHVDSHQHIHQFPIIGKTIQNILEKLKVKKIRNSFPLAANFGFRPNVLKLFTKLNPISRKDFICPEGLISNLSFGGELTLKDFSNDLISSYHNHSCLELMTHPGIKDRNDSYLKRKKEYLFWKENPIQELLKEKKIELIHYGNL
ncbi:ChbG/HpnK family deacetylase [Algoriphagus sp.]|uniref:carbohydrate deacetylase n=1 Tax=Algoriphagus sp. TaxID=1872435 RepID=UPI0025EEE316|nr:ChbG/HpnK family deacetylase [Algoriphagus sp.]